ncbi:monoacylglycerol lipase ABHD12-like [Limulus polyphemus]|uniref:Monoacylglycerol lipase ABHD12-like n=1 Tax=Limulus polyphemus TaxID=6850 RepID=A0ABM1BMX8_LIMPO|nr:monoacylglycerol lipase ABHD12-like [Limulus polyphemus]
MHQRRKTNEIRNKDTDSKAIETIPSHPYKDGVKSSASGKQLCQQGHRVLMIGLIIFGLFPLLFYFSSWVRCQYIFGPLLNWPPYTSLSSPQNLNLNCTINHNLGVEEGVTLGIWHILPKSQPTKCEKGLVLETEFEDNRPVFLYLHGIIENRGASHRLGMYNVLSQSQVDSHVVTFDYRGFGDSSGTPTATGMTNDSKAVYWWLRKFVSEKRIVIWGHSMGAAVGLRLVDELLKDGESVAGLVLEAPFNTLDDVAVTYPPLAFLSFLPYFDTLIVEPLKDKDTFFNPEEHIVAVKKPILFLHARGDWLVPYSLGEKLYQKAQENRPSHMKSSVQFVNIDETGSYGCGHRWLSLDPKLPEVITKFLESLNGENIKATLSTSA